MRWTSRIRFLFLLPAVIWVLAFTIFPLGYSLYLAFYKIEQKVEVERVKEPMLDAAGQAGPRRQGPAAHQERRPEEPGEHRDLHRHCTTSSGCSAIRRSREAIRRHRDLRAGRGAVGAGPRLSAGPALQPAHLRPSGAAHGHDPADLRDAACGRLHASSRSSTRRAARSAGRGIPFLSNPNWALFSVILVDVWQWTPFCFLVFLAALQGVPDELYEAARIDGAGRLRHAHPGAAAAAAADHRHRAAAAAGRGAQAVRHPLRDDRRRPRRRDAALLAARLPHRPALLRPRLCQRHGLRAARRRR